MTRFIGEYHYTVDAKGRLNIPAKFRKVVSPEADETFVVCRAPGGCLRAYPKDEWVLAEQRIRARAENPTADTDREIRFTFSTLSESRLDGQGRITLSLVQMKIAGMAKDVFLFGGPGYVEIWDPKRFEEYLSGGDDFDTVFYQSVQSGIRGT